MHFACSPRNIGLLAIVCAIAVYVFFCCVFFFVPASSAAADASPVSRAELGRSSWTLLHKVAAAYPTVPTAAERASVENFFSSLGNVYPCDECAMHFRGMLAATPIDARGGTELALWLCARHNEVNARLGKPAFLCTKASLEARWGGCGCVETTSTQLPLPAQILQPAPSRTRVGRLRRALTESS